jgi:RNA polymerase-associated protein RTF1
MEEHQRIVDKRNLDQMLKDQTKGGDSESVSQAAKRQHSVRGATKEKFRKLDELKARRKAKDEKKRSKNSPRRDRSSSPMDMETDSEDEEDGQISKYDEEQEKDRKRYGKPEPDDEPVALEDLNKCRLTRTLLAKHCMAPWFEDYVKGAWVRYLIGQENGQPVYRVCEIMNLGVDLVKPYKIDDKIVNQTIELRHGESVRSFLMDKVSNSEFHLKEFERVQKVWQAEGVKLPSKRSLEKKHQELSKLSTQPMTESDVTAMLARKSELQTGKPTGQSATMERSRLNQARTLALRRQDFKEVGAIDQQLSELPAATGTREEEISDMLAKVNERNRKANLDAVRKSEIQEAERKRRDRKLQAAARASGTSTPVDPSARLRTVPKLFNSISRPGTPKSNGGTPLLQPERAGAAARSVSPLPSSALSGRLGSPGKSQTFEASIIDAIEVDLGDF